MRHTAIAALVVVAAWCTIMNLSAKESSLAQLSTLATKDWDSSRRASVHKTTSTERTPAPEAANKTIANLTITNSPTTGSPTASPTTNRPITGSPATNSPTTGSPTSSPTRRPPAPPTSSPSLTQQKETKDPFKASIWSNETVLQMDRYLQSKSSQQEPHLYNILTLPGPNITGRLNMSTGRLVVDVGDEVLFWNKKSNQLHLVEILKAMTLKANLDQIYFPQKEADINPAGNNKTYTVIQNDISNIILARPPLLNLTMKCFGRGNAHGGYGQGNWVEAILMARMAATTAQVDFQCQCHQDLDEKGRPGRLKYLTPWFSGYYPTFKPKNLVTWPHDPSGQIPTGIQVAMTVKAPGGPQGQAINKMSNAIIEGVQQMVQHMEEPEDGSESTLKGINFDDVAIHFRCGDVMGKMGWRNDYGVTKYTEYPKYIRKHIRNDKDVKSIGILTQPWDRALLRHQDQGTEEKCRNATYLMVDYLQENFPEAHISIHNGPNETLPLAYARLARSRLVSFSSMSTFGILPTMASTRGQGYYQKGLEWTEVLPEQYPHLHMMTAPLLGEQMIHQIGFENASKWFVRDELCCEKENRQWVLKPCVAVESR